MKILKPVLLALPVLILAAGLFQERHGIACSLLPYSHFEAAGEGVYLDPMVPDTSGVVYALEQARNRNERLFGALTARPNVLIAATAETAEEYGGNGYGATVRSMLGLCVIVGPEGHNVDVLAHELVHAEVAHRIGLWATLFRLPVWFDEGLATLTDSRAPYILANLDVSEEALQRVKTFDTADQFFEEGRLVENYQAAKLAAHQIVERYGALNLYDGLARVREGESFADVFGFDRREVTDGGSENAGK